MPVIPSTDSNVMNHRRHTPITNIVIGPTIIATIAIAKDE
jgi:hypothetical protein